MTMDMTSVGLQDLANKALTAFKHLQFGNKKQLAFLEDLYTLINDGIPANRAIEMMGMVSEGINKEVAISLTEKIAEGQPLADGMSEWFSLNVVEIVRVGESGGALAQTLKSAINMLSQQGATMGAVIGAISYPTFVIIMACGVIVYMRNKVLVQFEAIKPLDTWPDEGRRLVWMAEIITHWWWAVILGIVVVIFLLKYVMANYVGELRPTLDKFPPFSFYRRLSSGRFLETLGLLVSNGVVFKSAIKVMQLQATPYMNSHLTMMEHLLSMGKTNIGDVLATGLVDPQDLMRLRIMAEVKGFEHGLVRMGVRGTEQATATMGKIAKVTGGLLLGVGGLMIIAIIQGIFMTGMSLAS